MLGVIDLIGDCWGDCCTHTAGVQDVLWERCGHHLDFRDEDVVKAHFGRLKRESRILGSVVERHHEIAGWDAGVGEAAVESWVMEDNMWDGVDEEDVA